MSNEAVSRAGEAQEFCVVIETKVRDIRKRFGRSRGIPWQCNIKMLLEVTLQ